MAAATDAAASPRAPTRAATTAASSWSHLVRASQSSSPPPADRSPKIQSADLPAIEIAEEDEAAVAGKGKKPAWNRPANGSVEAGPAVMGAESWPALSESTIKASPKASPLDSLKGTPDGSSSAPQAPLPASSPAKANAGSQSPSYGQNYALPGRQKYTKQGTGDNVIANGGPPTPSLPPVMAEIAAPDKHAAPEKQAGLVHSPNKNHTLNHSNWDHGPRGRGFAPHPGNDPHRGYGGARRGGGPHKGAFGSNRDHERGGYGWNPPRAFSGQDGHPQHPPPPRGAPRPFFRPPIPAPVPLQLIAPGPPLRPYMNHFGFGEMSSPIYFPVAPPESIRNMPLVAPISPPMVFYQQPDLGGELLRQIEYYFSTENMVKDIWLRQRMDDQGWVPVSLIAGFKKVARLTNDLQMIMDTIRLSNELELQGDKVRKRHDWEKWPLPLPSPAVANHDPLVARIQNIKLEDDPNSVADSNSN